MNLKEVRRQVELVQQLQRDVLGSLAALQTISNQLPPLPGGGVDPRIAQLTADVNAVVPLLTVADQLTGSDTIESKLAFVVATNPALAAHAAELQAQLKHCDSSFSPTPTTSPSNCSTMPLASRTRGPAQRSRNGTLILPSPPFTLP